MKLYLYCENWERFQDARLRSKPAWIKLWIGLGDDRAYRNLSLKGKALLPLLWTLVGRRGNAKLEADARMIADLGGLQGDVDLLELVIAGFFSLVTETGEAVIDLPDELWGQPTSQPILLKGGLGDLPSLEQISSDAIAASYRGESLAKGASVENEPGLSHARYGGGEERRGEEKETLVEQALDQEEEEAMPALGQLSKKRREPVGDAQRVWASYEAHHPQARFTTQRRELIQRRLKDYAAETLIAAVEGNHCSPYHCGENSEGKRYHDLGLILRDADKIEQFAGFAPKPEESLDMEERMELARSLGWPG